ncbi:MAG: PfaD family polyunsaturated fatty acid/polyketide biosynthesis protein [Gammaproteobacteria bacterium]|nr:PfaD family polyunsaturated fatty acid/polyketide biosynthesis protein [Gammaproteobacteria bacterium]
MFSDPELSPFSPESISQAIQNFRSTTHVIYNKHYQEIGTTQSSTPELNGEVIGTLPPMYPEWLGDRQFCDTHKLRFAYVGGAMARGISSSEMVIALGKIGAMGCFGSAGLHISKVEEAIHTISTALDPIGASWSVNLIHTPATPEDENALIDLYLKYGVKRISAAAFMGSNKALIRYVAKGLSLDSEGNIQRAHYLFPKVSRTEVAEHFLKPPPVKLVQELLTERAISEEEASLVLQIPLAEDLTVESDSGGHTDSRPLNTLFSSIAHQRDLIQAEYQFETPVRLGAAGSLGTPESIAAAFSLGASYVLIGSVHQSAIESGLSDLAKSMLAKADITDTIVTPSADMFEIGGKVQVLKKNTMMGLRGNRLQEIYNRYSSLDELPPAVQKEIEKSIFNDSLANIWTLTQRFFQQIDPREISRAESSPKYKMALVFRWYLGNSSKWALQGTADRQLDFQIWCGPAMGAFNRWVSGSFLQEAENRSVVQIALNLLEGAALHTRAQQLRCYGVPVQSHLTKYIPQHISY